MKKLNRKGFTLIELLAVIVILAIVLVVTIPSVLSTMNDARDKNLQNAADTVAEWFTKQYELAVLGSDLGSGNVSAAYTTFGLTATQKPLTKDVLIAAGIADADSNLDLTKSIVVLNGTKVCVKLTARSGGSFYNNDTTKYTIEFVPNDTDNYEIVDVLDIVVVVNKSSNTITEEQLNAITVTDIIYGQKLSESTINATSTIPGTFAWENEDIIPTVLEGISNTYNIVFTPDDTNNYESTIISIKVKVNKATPAVPDDINVNITASDIEVGQPLSQSQLSYIGETTLNGELSWANPDIIPTIEDSDVTLYDVIFTPIDNANYNTITYNTTIHVNKTDAPEKYIDYKIPASTNSGTKNTIDFNNILYLTL